MHKIDYRGGVLELDDLLANRLSTVQLTGLISLIYLTPSIVNIIRNPTTILNRDTSLFHYAGWSLARGNVPYVDIWDVKPPITLEYLAVLELLLQDSSLVIIVGSLTTVASITGAVVLITLIIEETVHNAIVAAISGVTLFTYPGISTIAGFSPKIVFLVFGLSAIYCSLKDYYKLAGVAGAISAGLWQFAIVYTAAAFIVSWRRGNRKAIKFFVIGVVLVTTIVVLPIVFVGGGVAMFIEVVIVPLTISESIGLLRPLYVIAVLDWASVPVITAGIAGFYAIKSSKQIQTAMGFYLIGWFQVLFLDFDGGGDVYILLSASVILLGISLIHIMKDADYPTRFNINIFTLAIVIMLIIAPQIASLSAAAIEIVDIHRQSQSNSESVSGQLSTEAVHGYSMDELYLNRIKIDSCHIRLSPMEKRWISHTKTSVHDKKCGDPQTIIRMIQ